MRHTNGRDNDSETKLTLPYTNKKASLSRDRIYKEQMLIKNRIKIETKLKEMCELVSVVRESLTRYKTTVQALGLLVSFS